MGLSIRNPETVALAKKLAQRKGRGITETIHHALEQEAERLDQDAAFVSVDPLIAATRRAREQLGFAGRQTEALPKAFFDSLWE
jgi:hypothetical protein